MSSGEEELEINLTLQREEIEALSAIYGEDFLLEQDYSDDYLYDDDDNTTITAAGDDGSTKSLLMPTFSISIRPDNEKRQNDKAGQLEARLIVSFQPGYPSISPPVYQLSVPWLRGGQKQFLADALEELYLDHLGESIVYIWVEKLRELLSPGITAHGEEESTCNKSKVFGLSDSIATYSAATEPISSKELIDHFSNSLALTFVDDGDGNTAGGSGGGEEAQYQAKSTHAPTTNSPGYMEIHTGATLTDRKSTFQAHVTPINEICQVRLVLNQLYQNKKIAAATHNMYAYRILKEDSKTWLQDCDDDGETHAGSRLLHLLQILNCRNVVVVVSRWYGGIQLHADRFKHINNVARQTLSEFGFIPTVEGKKADDSSKIKKGVSKR